MTFLVSIDGPRKVGKTALAEALKRILAPPRSVLLIDGGFVSGIADAILAVDAGIPTAAEPWLDCEQQAKATTMYLFLDADPEKLQQRQPERSLEELTLEVMTYRALMLERSIRARVVRMDAFSHTADELATIAAENLK